MQKIKGTALVWFRNDLRITDHYSLFNASKDYENVVAYFCFDLNQFKENQWGFKKTSSYRTQFLIESVLQVQKELEEKNITLIIEKQDPVIGITEYAESEKINAIYFQKEWTEEELKVENNLRKKLSHITFHSYYDQFLFHPEDIPMNLKQLPEVFTRFRKECEKNTIVRACYTSVKKFDLSNRLKKSFLCPTL
ncbi:MAG: deoxyribodipyrimidine photo-lyase, partial [Flavobacteriaceae bacterium]|nr:deoxyribodipyrimidine photo-lyase [Flavobacteriaceae bacterium]MDO7582241.1 deoxyribodipyrimidine photo-lyase [Flavobacteriaceae bacterium]MDO7591047.1 deoxyribodipyrimidine photo-lyase [Flavobacteriaceae bacterium]MDO7598546.1 deoxyribodipyrimidine photo-lyase [Flavobacteriaceae bacterium]MDO7603030.1 deoxyribodipyrimidine photo-lyase [Flavobacteriaceae bacterium]